MRRIIPESVLLNIAKVLCGTGIGCSVYFLTEPIGGFCWECTCKRFNDDFRLLSLTSREHNRIYRIKYFS